MIVYRCTEERDIHKEPAVVFSCTSCVHYNPRTAVCRMHMVEQHAITCKNYCIEET